MVSLVCLASLEAADLLDRLVHRASQDRQAHEVVRGLMGHPETQAIQASRDLPDHKVLRASLASTDVLVRLELLEHQDK